MSECVALGCIGCHIMTHITSHITFLHVALCQVTLPSCRYPSFFHELRHFIASYITTHICHIICHIISLSGCTSNQLTPIFSCCIGCHIRASHTALHHVTLCHVTLPSCRHPRGGGGGHLVWKRVPTAVQPLRRGGYLGAGWLKKGGCPLIIL